MSRRERRIASARVASFADLASGPAEDATLHVDSDKRLTNLFF